MRPASPEILEQQIRDAMARDDWFTVHQLAQRLDAAEQAKTPPQLLPSALWYASLGIPVFPLQPGGKRPVTRHGVDDATTEQTCIHDWWKSTPAANIGLACGHTFDVIDIDGPQAVIAWARIEGLPDPLGSVSTPRPGGTHLYVPPLGIGNTTGSIAPGIDTRSHGGYVVAPPSILHAGMPGVKAAGTYRWRRHLTLDAAREAAA